MTLELSLLQTHSLNKPFGFAQDQAILRRLWLSIIAGAIDANVSSIKKIVTRMA